MNAGYVSTREAEIFGDSDGSELPPGLKTGSLILGLKWEPANVDLDLHVGLNGKPERLSFRNPQTGFGTLRKDFATGWEEAYLSSEVFPNSVDVAVNFYGGQAPRGGVKAELRVVFAGTLYSRKLLFPGVAGNGGRIGSPKHWQQVDLADVMQLRR